MQKVGKETELPFPRSDYKSVADFGIASSLQTVGHLLTKQDHVRYLHFPFIMSFIEYALCYLCSVVYHNEEVFWCYCQFCQPTAVYLHMD